jgi:adenosylcobyric acid synthase
MNSSAHIHGGTAVVLTENSCSGSKKKTLIDFSANTSPIGMHPVAAAELRVISSSQSFISEFSAYPDSECTHLRKLLSSFWHIQSENIVCGSGAADVLYGIAALARSGISVIVEPAFSEYESALKSASCSGILHFLLDQKTDFSFSEERCAELKTLILEKKPSLLFAASPSNPAGTVIPQCIIEEIASACEKAHTVFVLDACFAQFDKESESSLRKSIAQRKKYPHLVVINAFTKFYGMAGVRLGYALCFSKGTAQKLYAAMRPWAVSTGAQLAGCAVIESELRQLKTKKESSWQKEIRSLVACEKQIVVSALKNAGAQCINGNANFILFSMNKISVQVKGQKKITGIEKYLLSYGICIRSCSDFLGLDSSWYRVSVQSHKKNEELIKALSSIPGYKNQQSSCKSSLKEKVSLMTKHVFSDSRFSHQAVPIMIQGTMSNAGKSVLVAAFCRIFTQDGYKVAPFKSQNMALNSGVTPDGLEMGRAQIMQAGAAKKLPDIRMNPILLKPCSDTKSQIIVNGKPVKTSSAAEYYRFKKSLLPVVRQSYESLAEENDIIVIEGAGSPAEINLRKNDIANMSMAEIADAPVIIAGDIDRGGVFASLYGTVNLLEQKDRSRIKGFIINKFRGDKAILDPGLRQLTSLVHIPFLGVVPFIPHLEIDDEDSLSPQDKGDANTTVGSKKNTGISKDTLIHIAAVNLPFMSNFTDLASFNMFGFVHVSFFSSRKEFDRNSELYGAPQMLVIPGTKNTLSALAMLKKSGADSIIRQIASEGKPVIGICGGYQLLGQKLHDPLGTEDDSAAKSVKALCLLPAETTFTREKTRRTVSGVIPSFNGLFSPLSGLSYTGYEIHQGVTTQIKTALSCKEFADECNFDTEREFPGIACGNVLGTYVHGFFDSTEIVTALVRMLIKQRIKNGQKVTEAMKAVCAKNMSAIRNTNSNAASREREYDRLAQVVRESVDIKRVYRILKERGLRK